MERLTALIPPTSPRSGKTAHGMTDSLCIDERAFFIDMPTVPGYYIPMATMSDILLYCVQQDGYSTGTTAVYQDGEILEVVVVW